LANPALDVGRDEVGGAGYAFIILANVGGRGGGDDGVPVDIVFELLLAPATFAASMYGDGCGASSLRRFACELERVW
jgi:hypothetical protein